MPKDTFFNLPEAKRQRITDLAVEEFAVWPYPQASLSRIVERAGIAKGSMYQYFQDKFDLYRWLVTDVLPQRKRALLEASAPGTDRGFFAGLHRMLRQGLHLFQSEPLLARIGVRVLETVEDPQAQALHTEMIQASHTAAMAMLEQGKARGEVRPESDSRLTAHLWIALMGPGLLAALMDRVPGGMAAFQERPTALACLTDADLDAVAGAIVTLLQYGVALSKTEERS